MNNLSKLQKRRISQITLTLVVNLVRTVLSAKFICCCWRNPWCDCYVTHTHRNVMSQPKYEQIINCGLTILIVSMFPLYHLRITTQLRSVAVDKPAGIFTKRIWQPYPEAMCIICLRIGLNVNRCLVYLYKLVPLNKLPIRIFRIAYHDDSDF